MNVIIKKITKQKNLRANNIKSISEQVEIMQGVIGAGGHGAVRPASGGGAGIISSILRLPLHGFPPGLWKNSFSHQDDRQQCRLAGEAARRPGGNMFG